MTKDDVIRMARQAGGIDLCIREQITWIDTASNEFLERFAALVAAHTLSNIDPSKFMSHREGFEAGAAAEREAYAKARASLEQP